MTTNSTKPTSKPGHNGPSHAVHQVKDREGKKALWTRLGSAWPHEDGQGFNIQVESVPLDGRLVLRVITDKKD